MILINLNWRHYVIFLLAVAPLIGLFFVSPIPQDPLYHAFADQRTWLGLPNFADVTSNLPFLFVGVLGLYQGWKGRIAGFSVAWACFFVGVSLVSVGSAYYHYHPTNSTLVWDRLPMTVGFMALFVALLSELVDSRLHLCLLPAILLGLASVIYWNLYDDLRFYVWVQFAPLLIIPAMIVMFPSRFSHSYLLIVALACYLLAKILEAEDTYIFKFTQHLVAGHAIKHIMAAAGCFFIFLMLRLRQKKTSIATPQAI